MTPGESEVPKLRLVEVCEPLFLEICRTNRALRLNVPGLTLPVLKGRIKKALAAVGENVGLARPEVQVDQYPKIKNHLLYFADYMMRTALSGTGMSWSNLAEEPENGQLRGGDTAFFDDKETGLDKTLLDTTTSGTERLAVFYTCLCLGFEGMYRGSGTDYIKSKISELATHLPQDIDLDDQKRICEQAYKSTDERKPEIIIGKSLALIGAVLAALILIVLILNCVFYYLDTKELIGRVATAHALLHPN